MPKSRNKVKVINCPECGLSCSAGKARLERHRRNQCKGSKVQAKRK